MRKYTLLLSAFFFLQVSFAQYNFGFEELESGSQALKFWNRKDGEQATGGLFKIDGAIKHSGNYSLSIERLQEDPVFKFTHINVRIPVDFEGVNLLASCWLKTQDVTNYAQMWVRIDDANGKMLKLVNHPAQLKGTTDWQRYEATVSMPDDASVIYLGFLITGKGKVWSDDFSLLVDGQPFARRTKAEKQPYKALLDQKEFEKGSGITITNPTDFQLKSLALLGKLWGFLKYYHPYVAEGNVNWDYELFRFLPSFLSVTSKEQRNDALLKWTNQLGEVKRCTSCHDKVLKTALLKPDLDWISDAAELGNSLVAALNHIKNNRHQGRQYYIDLMPGVQNPKIMHEDAYSQFAYPDAGYRLLSLFRYWNLIQYWFPNKDVIGEDWQPVLIEFVPKFLAAKNEEEYVLTVQQLIARIHDTHANIWGINKVLENQKGNYFPPVKITFVDNKAVVCRVINSKLAQASNLQTGDVILSINNKKVEDIIRERLPNLPASNYPTQLRDLSRYLLRSNDSISTVSVLRHNQQFETRLIRLAPVDKFKWYAPDFAYQKDSSFFFIQPGIGYINLGKIRKAQVDSVFQLLKGAKGLIIDNRQYPGDFPIYQIAQKLLPERMAFTIIPVGQLDYPGSFNLKKPLYAGGKNKNYFKGKVVILVNEETQSSGEFHSMAFRLAPSATVMGSTTAGADGNVSGFYLPGGLYTMFSGIGILYPDGRPTQRVRIVPDIEVKRTLQGITENKDELIEKAIECINAPASNDTKKTLKAF